MNAKAEKPSKLMVEDKGTGGLALVFPLREGGRSVPPEVWAALSGMAIDPTRMFMRVGLENNKGGGFSMYTYPFGLGLPQTAADAWQQLIAKAEHYTANANCAWGQMEIRPRLYSLTAADVAMASAA